jgi:hypothetical protein
MTEPFEGCRVVGLLRSGPVADLYEAIQEPLGRRVLIKALSPSILPSSPFAAVLEREARVVADLDHPGVVRLFDFVRRADRMWLVLELVDGWELQEVLARVPDGTPLGAAAGAAIALQLAEALDHAHRRGVVHRELNPERVLLSREGTVKLTGFSVHLDDGVAALPEAVDVTGVRSAGYLAPEQILGEGADPRGDLFSLGVILYELVGGRCPFIGEGDVSTAQRVRHDSPPLLSRLNPDVPGSLERLVARCLEKLPGDRFQSAAEVAAGLRGVLAELGVPDATAAVRDALARVGLLADRESVPRAPRKERERTPGVPLRGLVIAFALMAGGGVLIQRIDAATAGPEGSPGALPLELAPPEAGSLRVVADPWAHVFVEGQQVATTPFAKPIPLRPGTHHVRLDHPKAPSEHRTLTFAPGESILLDVTLKVERPAPEPSPLPPIEEDDSP